MRRVGFLKKKVRLAPSGRSNPEEMHSYPVFLSLLHADSEILIAGQKNALRHRPICEPT